MKITFFSNYFNSHQLPLALEFNAMDDVEYTFVSLLRTEGSVGRISLDLVYPFVLREYDGPKEASMAMDHALSDDVVVFGDMEGKEQYIRARAKTGRLFFRYAERLLKRGDWWRFVPFKQYRTWDRFGRYKDANMYVLCASAYTARDLSLFGFPPSKCLKWGYFPQVKESEDSPNYSSETLATSREISICSVQRLIPLKHVDLQLHALQQIRKNGFEVVLRIAGEGVERSHLEQLCYELGLSDVVQFMGELSHDEALALMKISSVFLATSDRHEGWGATVNEAMAMGCCVIGSREMGSVPFLIKDGVNGLIFDGSIESLTTKLSLVLNDPRALDEMGKKASSSLREEWSAASAARSLFCASTPLLSGVQSFPNAGPMSKIESELMDEF